MDFYIAGAATALAGVALTMTFFLVAEWLEYKRK